MNKVRKYRAKRKDTGEWIQGSLVFTYNVFYIINYEHILIGEDDPTPHFIEVNPETICQAIGVKGFVGERKIKPEVEVELFEGDVVEAWSEGYQGIFMIWFRNGGAPTFILYPAWRDGRFWSVHASDLGRQQGDYFDNLKLLGNVFDNPEYEHLKYK